MYTLDKLLERVVAAKPNTPILEPGSFEDAKDPCPVFDGRIWHIFGSGGRARTEIWQMLHAKSQNIEGPWQLEEPAFLYGVKGPHVAAPGVVFEDNKFHMFVQSTFLELGGTIEYLTSEDEGLNFSRVNTSLTSIPDSPEAGIYDPHPAVIDERKYIVYTGMPRVSRGDLFLACSITNRWEGPWERMGKILSHEEIPHHNQHDHKDYEWGLEGGQLVMLPNGHILLNAVCFLPDGRRGGRQRVFFAISDRVSGPYTTLGPVLTPSAEGWDSGENGHAAAVLEGENLHLFYQARPLEGLQTYWRYGIATWRIRDIEGVV